MKQQRAARPMGCLLQLGSSQSDRPMRRPDQNATMKYVLATYIRTTDRTNDRSRKTTGAFFFTLAGGAVQTRSHKKKSLSLGEARRWLRQGQRQQQQCASPHSTACNRGTTSAANAAISIAYTAQTAADSSLAWKGQDSFAAV